VHQVTLYQGGKYCDWDIRKSQLITPLLAKRTGRPVRCLNTRADTGKVLRPTSLEGQIQQTMMFSEGCQLSEEILWDKTTSVRLNSNMFEYKKPTVLDIGPTEMDLLETRAGNAAYGANGISHSLANSHIIICAIQNAIGKWVDPPATPDRILKAMGKA
jgi:CO/xanthine dehydrogenase Mo-binding subunit